MRNRPALARDRQRARYSFRNDFEWRRRACRGSIACYTELERCPAHSGSLVLVLAPLTRRKCSGAIYSQKRAVRLTPSSPGRARQSTLRKILLARRRSWRLWGPLQVHFRNLEEPRRMCGTATALAQHTPDVWHCHVSRAACVGCVALPRFSRVPRRQQVNHAPP